MNLSNQITLLRIMLIPVILGTLAFEHSMAARTYATATLFTIACLTDALDGFIAKRLGMVTRLGQTLDPLADKLLLIAVYGILSFTSPSPNQPVMPLWLTSTVFSICLLVLLGIGLLYLMHKTLHTNVRPFGKITTFMQMLCAATYLWGIPNSLQFPLMVATFLLTVLSGLMYIKTGLQLFLKETHPA